MYNRLRQTLHGQASCLQEDTYTILLPLFCCHYQLILLSLLAHQLPNTLTLPVHGFHVEGWTPTEVGFLFTIPMDQESIKVDQSVDNFQMRVYILKKHTWCTSTSWNIATFAWSTPYHASILHTCTCFHCSVICYAINDMNSWFSKHQQAVVDCSSSSSITIYFGG